MENKIAVTALEALAQESRLDIFRLLVSAAPAGIAAGEIGKRLKLPAATLSFHLAQLKHAGLASHERQSRSRIYSANLNAMNDLLSFLTENCCGGNPGKCRPMTLNKSPRRKK